MKSYMQALSRNDHHKTPGNTKTPRNLTGTIKKRPIGTADRYRSTNTTVNQSRILPSVPRNRLMSTSTVNRNDMSYMQQTYDSTANNTFSILNVSSSTEVDGVVEPNQAQALSVPPQAPFTFSPLMRQIEKAIDTKFSTMMETLKDDRRLGDTINITQYHENLKKAVMNEVTKDETTFVIQEDGIADSTFEISENPQTTSTVMRKPTMKRSNQTQANMTLMKTNLETTSIGGRRSKRSSTRNQEDDVDVEPTAAKNRRLTAVVNISPINPALLSSLSRRRSVRISTYELNRRLRRSVTPKQSAAKKKKTVIKNAVVLDYFSQLENNISKPEHKKAILKVMNKGSIKELKMLPAIGPKTALQIVSHRAVHGSYEALNDLQKLPAMKGKLWEKFLEVRRLISE